MEIIGETWKNRFFLIFERMSTADTRQFMRLSKETDFCEAGFTDNTCHV